LNQARNSKFGVCAEMYPTCGGASSRIFVILLSIHAHPVEKPHGSLDAGGILAGSRCVGARNERRPPVVIRAVDQGLPLIPVFVVAGLCEAGDSWLGKFKGFAHWSTGQRGWSGNENSTGPA